MSPLGLRARVVLVVCLALIPAFGLLIWLHAVTRQARMEEAVGRVTIQAQLVAGGQASRNEGARQLLTAIVRRGSLREPTAPACSQYLHDVLEGSVNVYINFGVIDRAGLLVCSSDFISGLQVGDRPFFMRALAARSFTVGELIRGRRSGRPLVNYSLPVMDGGEVRGVAIASLNVDWLRDWLRSLPIEQGAGLAVLDRTGAVIARHPDGGWLEAQLSADAFARAGRQALTVERRAGPDGVVRQYAAAWVDERHDMLAIAAVPDEAAEVGAARTVTTALLVLLGAGLLGLAVALTFAEREILKPIGSLVASARRLGTGDLDTRSAVTSGAAELQELSGAFNNMAEVLQAREHNARESQRLEAIGQLAGGLAHDFNNVLTIILGFSHDLRSEVKSPEGRQNIDEIVAAAERAGKLTHQLLAFAKRQVLLPRPMQINQTVTQTESMMRQVIGSDITVTSALDPGLWIVRADPSQMEQVVLNLVINARDAMPSGGRLRIETRNLTVVPGQRPRLTSVGKAAVPPGDYVSLSISDSGLGMDAEVRARVFEPFFSTKGARGTGLGLAIVYGIISQSGGFICCESAPGMGTTMTVLLPRVDDLLPEEVGSRSAEGVWRRGSETILLVEDEPSVRLLAERVLRSAGYVVDVIDTPARALDRLRTGPQPHLLLTDVVMPQMDGVALVAAARQIAPGLPAVYMSGHADHPLVRSAQVDPAHFLLKPFTPDGLLRVVRTVLDSGTTR